VASVYRPRGMPARYLDSAPDIVRKNVLDLLIIMPAAPLDFDVVLRPEPNAAEIVTIDFDRHGARGCHAFLKPREARAYRERNRRKRVAWADLPEPTRKSILRYLAEEA
jgi:hypothetical protein